MRYESLEAARAAGWTRAEMHCYWRHPDIPGYTREDELLVADDAILEKERALTRQEAPVFDPSDPYHVGIVTRLREEYSEHFDELLTLSDAKVFEASVLGYYDEGDDPDGMGVFDNLWEVQNA